MLRRVCLQLRSKQNSCACGWSLKSKALFCPPPSPLSPVCFFLPVSHCYKQFTTGFSQLNLSVLQPWGSRTPVSTSRSSAAAFQLHMHHTPWQIWSNRGTDYKTFFVCICFYALVGFGAYLATDLTEIQVDAQFTVYPSWKKKKRAALMLSFLRDEWWGGASSLYSSVVVSTVCPGQQRPLIILFKINQRWETCSVTRVITMLWKIASGLVLLVNVCRKGGWDKKQQDHCEFSVIIPERCLIWIRALQDLWPLSRLSCHWNQLRFGSLRNVLLFFYPWNAKPRITKIRQHCVP